MHNAYIALSTATVLTILIGGIAYLAREIRQVRINQSRLMTISTRGVHALEDLTRPSGPQKVHARR